MTIVFNGFVAQRFELRYLLLTIVIFFTICLNAETPTDSIHDKTSYPLLEVPNKPNVPPQGLLTGISQWLIEQYQTKISPRSISRCMFEISCSNYASKAISEKGLILGIAYFIDRNLYREHTHARQYYQLVVNHDESLKLSDTYFITNE